jgi:hypothetical protein
VPGLPVDTGSRVVAAVPSPDGAAAAPSTDLLTTRGTVLSSYATPLSRRTRAVLAVPAAALALASLAACGGGGSGATVAAATGSATGSPASPAAGGAANGFAAYTDCLAKHGVTLPTGRPAGAARPTGSRVPGSGFGGGGFGGLNATSGPTAAAVKACAALRPTGGFGGGGANSSAIASQLTAYRACLSDHGVTLPTAAPRSSGAPAAGASAAPGRRAGLGGIGALNTADPKVAAAVKACAPLRPAFGAGAGATRSPGTVPVPVPTGTPNA